MAVVCKTSVTVGSHGWALLMEDVNKGLNICLCGVFELFISCINYFFKAAALKSGMKNTDLKIIIIRF